MYRQGWVPGVPARAVVVIVHGLFEHSGRYEYLAGRLVERGFTVEAYDHRGHGRSEGLRGYVRLFNDYVDDLDSFLDTVLREHPGQKVFLLGHSMGGTVAAVCASRCVAPLSGLVLSAALAMPGESVTRGSIMMARALSVITPKLGIAAIESSGVSRDENVVKAYVSDPLVYTGKIRARLGAELINTLERSLPAALPRLTMPVLIMQGTEDRLSNRAGAQMLHESVGSSDRTLKYYSGLYHEIFNEPEKEQVIADFLAWLEART